MDLRKQRDEAFADINQTSLIRRGHTELDRIMRKFSYEKHDLVLQDRFAALIAKQRAPTLSVTREHWKKNVIPRTRATMDQPGDTL